MRTYHPAWMSEATSVLTDVHARFHQECLDFAEWVRVKDYSRQEALFSKIKKRVRERY